MKRACEIRVRGQVQGVGFRPFVWQLARRIGLTGHVLNDAEGVFILAIGAAQDLSDFETALRRDAPPLAQVDLVKARPCDMPQPLPSSFEIAASGPPGANTRVTPDAATCPACLAETKGEGRRGGYAFTNCTHCGPRFTIVTGLPYDRGRTTMAPFVMCEACSNEYEAPADRRFHAQPIACPTCGPRLWYEGDEGDPIDAASAALLAGKVVAIKGLGGFHLAVDATNGAAIDLLRARKRRPTKPLAVMGDEAMLRRFGAATAQERDMLRTNAAPIVLIPSRGRLPETLAPGQSTLGWMLPYTPLHHLLIRAVGRPLVMTSGNLSGEPQVIGNDEARTKLGAFADGFLMHDRDIARRLDDSVERILPSGPMVLRRARGRVPETLPLPPGFEAAPEVIAMGGEMKAAFCLTKNNQALLSHHLGSLGGAQNWAAYETALRDYTELFDHAPLRVAVDLHDGYRASRAGEALGLEVVRVQHHHAHLASVMGENGWALEEGKVAGIILDGLGLGADGTLWGGEVLLGDYHGFERRAHLLPAPLLGGDAASREPWRNALARLDQTGLSAWADELFADKPLGALRAAAKAGMNAPLSSSAGRLFDAVAACLGFGGAQSFEGEAAMTLEARATGDHPPYPFSLRGDQIDPTPLFAALRGDAPDVASARFHAGLAQAFAAQARALVEGGEAKAVALSGGCFQNARLMGDTLAALGDVPVLLHHSVPANDGGLALGQALIAAAVSP